MSEVADLYETDFVRWAEDQARALRDAGQAGANLPVDWENVAEEIEGLARTDRRRLKSRLETIIEHLLKLRFSPAVEPRSGWRDTIRRSRREVETLLSESPSLRREVSQIATQAWTAATDDVVTALLDYGEDKAAAKVRLNQGCYSSAQLLDKDFFPHPVSN